MPRARLGVMRETTDGFRIAEKDLELRGTGELLGTRQTGQLAFCIADLPRDTKSLPAVQSIGETLLCDYPDLVERLMVCWIDNTMLLKCETYFSAVDSTIVSGRDPPCRAIKVIFNIRNVEPNTLR